MPDMILAPAAFAAGLVAIPILLGLTRAFGVALVVPEQTAVVFTLFGKVLGTIDEPGLHFPVRVFGPRAVLIPFFGKRYEVNLALRQSYLRGQMVNSEEGTPMGIGIWYEMKVVNPVDYLFVNANPEASLTANVANSTVSSLSNLEMETMLEDRHSLSRTVRATVSPLSERWGYQLGSVYIRKVAFTDQQMVRDITDKVVKRLVQVTSAMKQDGENRVGLIKSQTAKTVSREMARALATRPEVVGQTLNAISKRDPEVLEAVLDVMETQALLDSGATVDLVPRDGNVLIQLGDGARGGAPTPAGEGESSTWSAEPPPGGGSIDAWARP